MTAKAFIDALQKLRLSRPRIALMASASENSDYTNYAYRNKNCYLVFGNHAEYEILNQKYSKEEYFQKVAQIKGALKQDGFYGSWLLPSTYPYEDSIAPQYYS